MPWAKPPLTVESLVGPEWARDAACRHLAPEEADAYFFPERGHSADKGRALCGRCPVAKECLDMALTAGVEFGTFGGVSARERRALVRERSGGRARAAAEGLCVKHYGRERRRG